MYRPKVSVIVPVYNTQKYIERCARSLFSQTLREIEYIFVDDGSQDDSISLLQKIADEYPARKKDILILHKTNGGLASARSLGMQHANGDYIIHCDSDDWVDENYYEKLYLEAISSNADLVIGSIVHVYSKRRDRWQYYISNSGKDVLKGWYRYSVAMYNVNKLVKKKLIFDNNIVFFEGINMWEDNGFMFRVMYYAKRISSIQDSAYYYDRTNNSALTKHYGRNEIDQMIECARRLDDFFKGQPDYSDFTRTINALKYMARLNLVVDRFDWLAEFKALFPESDEAKNYIKLSSFSKKGKIRFLCVKYKLAWLFVLTFKIKKALLN